MHLPVLSVAAETCSQVQFTSSLDGNRRAAASLGVRSAQFRCLHSTSSFCFLQMGSILLILRYMFIQQQDTKIQLCRVKCECLFDRGPLRSHSSFCVGMAYAYYIYQGLLSNYSFFCIIHLSLFK